MRLVYLSPVPWASFAQRPQRFAMWFHKRTGGKILWINPYPTRFPVLGDLRRKKNADITTSSIPDWLSVMDVSALPIEPMPGSRWINQGYWRNVIDSIQAFTRDDFSYIGIGKPSKLALTVLDNTTHCVSLYDAMDDFPAFYRGWSRWAMDRRERRLLKRVDKVIVSSSQLRLRLSRYHGDIILALNACDTAELPPVALPPASDDRPVLGYVGTIGHWFDWELIINLAHQNPDMIVRLIGPVYYRPPSNLPHNVEQLPACDHKTAIEAMQQFSVGLIPFKITDLTHSVDPIKYYEYRALGLPVLSTAFGEMAGRGNVQGVYLVSARNDLRRALSGPLRFRDNLAAITEFRTRNSWDARFDSIGVLENQGPA